MGAFPVFGMDKHHLYPAAFGETCSPFGGTRDERYRKLDGTHTYGHIRRNVSSGNKNGVLRIGIAREQNMSMSERT
jgi:hypothetical protein